MSETPVEKVKNAAFYTAKIMGSAASVVGENAVAAAYQAGNVGGKMYSGLASKITAGGGGSAAGGGGGNVAGGGGSAAGGAGGGNELLKKIGKATLYTAAGTGLILGGIAVAVPVIGFTAGGVGAGTMAAAYQATLGGTIAAGSSFATLQSIGAAGLAVSTKVGVAGATGAAALYKVYREDESKL